VSLIELSTLPAENEYLNCIRCGLCLAVCPTYHEYKTETASPRGRVALARKSLEGELELSPNLVEQMYACFGCLACDEICPVGIKPAELALEMRNLEEHRHPSGWKNFLFGGIIGDPRRMELATLWLRLYQATGLRWLVDKFGIRKVFPGQLRDMEGMLPHQPRHPLRNVLPEVTPASGETRYRVGFFLGCAQSLMFAEESAASVRVMARNGCMVITPPETKCCGMPMRGYGRMDLVKEHARFNIALFENSHVDVIVTDCATCGSTLKDYGNILADEPEWAERAAKFSTKVRDIHEFLLSIPLEKPAGKIEARVTYHDPCHLRRAQHVWQQPRNLLQMIDGIEFVELPGADTCCGSAGSQLITHYDTSIRVLERKMDALESTEATMIASGCPGCQMQLLTGIKRRHLDVQVVHPVQLLDQAYNSEKRQP
jgi:glycolate oxidase iron-sulfur subunit